MMRGPRGPTSHPRAAARVTLALALCGLAAAACGPSEAGELADPGVATDSTVADDDSAAVDADGATSGTVVDTLPDTVPVATTDDPAGASAQDRLRQLVARAREAIAGVTGVGSGTGDGAGGAAADSTPRPPQPEALVGRWHHGDMRSKFGDSLTLVLRDDGTATALERRYTLDDRAGWRVARVEREGRWEVVYDGGEPVRLCTSWDTPRAQDSCERMSLTSDTATLTPILQYAGRHWRPREGGNDGERKGRG